MSAGGRGIAPQQNAWSRAERVGRAGSRAALGGLSTARAGRTMGGPNAPAL